MDPLLESILDETQIQAFVQDRAEAVLPRIKESREKSGITGPVNGDELNQASMADSMDSIQTMIAKMKDAAIRHQGTRRGEILAALAENAELDSVAIETVLHEPTEEGLKAVSEQIVGRTNALTDRFFGDAES